VSARFVGMRVTTPKGDGEIHKIVDDVTWAGGEKIREQLIIVKLDDRPETGMRPVFYASQVKPLDDVTIEVVVEEDEASTVAENQAEALEAERHQEAKHGDPED
jgi:hypothetical protein